MLFLLATILLSSLLVIAFPDSITASTENKNSTHTRAGPLDPLVYTKSTIMLSLGETEQEVVETIKNLREVGVDMLNMGQYLHQLLEISQLQGTSLQNDFRSLKELLSGCYLFMLLLVLLLERLL